jgi:hypothetical protein
MWLMTAQNALRGNRAGRRPVRCGHEVEDLTVPVLQPFLHKGIKPLASVTSNSSFRRRRSLVVREALSASRSLRMARMPQSEALGATERNRCNRDI